MEDTILYIEPAQLHERMLDLRDKQQMDFLESLTGMDWGVRKEDEPADAIRGLGVVYHLESTVKCLVSLLRLFGKSQIFFPGYICIIKGLPYHITRICKP